MVCCYASLNRGLAVLSSNGLTSIVLDIHVHLHPPTSFTAETLSSCLSWLRSPSPPHVISNLEPSKLEGCWSAHPRCARADSQLGVEVRTSVPLVSVVQCYRMIIILLSSDCKVTGGISG